MPYNFGLYQLFVVGVANVLIAISTSNHNSTSNHSANDLCYVCFVLYIGNVVVGLKDAVFEHSSTSRHMCELFQVLQNRRLEKSILFIYTDGGSAHCLTYLSVKISLICLFLKLDLDYLCAGRTAPYHSWRNPVERIMSVLNLGLQSVGIARAAMPTDFESEVSKCNNLSELRGITSRNSGITEAVANSLSPVKSLLCSIFARLKLHENSIECFEAASTRELSEFWTAVISLDATLEEKTVSKGGFAITQAAKSIHFSLLPVKYVHI